MTDLIDSAPRYSFQEITPQAMRATMAAFCSGVVVVTSLGDEPHGFTCQSFVSLSMDPPLISISPARSSSTWPKIREVGIFAINVLAEDHAHLSKQFAVSGGRKFAAVDWSPAPLGSPILPGVSAWVECSLWREYDGGDHTIAIGEVMGLDHDLNRNPLLYHRGAYPQADWAGPR